MFRLFLFFLVLTFSTNLLSEEADIYFQDRKNYQQLFKKPNLISVYYGTFFTLTSRDWEVKEQGKIAGGNYFGVGYRLARWLNGFDFNVKGDFNNYHSASGEVSIDKLSFMGTFLWGPRNSPLYLGAGAGMGLFLNQLEEISFVSLDYHFLAGYRLNNLLGSFGFFIEADMRNHVHLFSRGQFNGLSLTTGLNANF